ncbi:MAG: Autotransporter adhesin [Haloquadratum sp. J07HQX50]|nr:MAG: Autotransporter adhesin [Haloquadratum sp. J07HQX50]
MVKNASATGDVGTGSTTGSSVGGLIGTVSGGQILTSYARGDVTTSGDRVGGLVGLTTADRIADSYARGNVTTEGDDVGGLIGDSTSNVTRAYTTGRVEGGNNITSGGLIGENSGQLSDAYWDRGATNQSTATSDGITDDSVIGHGSVENTTVASEMQGQSPSTFMPALDYTSTWSLVEGYPRLRSETAATFESDTTPPAITSVASTSNTSIEVTVDGGVSGVDTSSITQADFVVSNNSISSINTITSGTGVDKTQLIQLTVDSSIGTGVATVNLTSQAGGIRDNSGNELSGVIKTLPNIERVSVSDKTNNDSTLATGDSVGITVETSDIAISSVTVNTSAYDAGTETATGTVTLNSNGTNSETGAQIHDGLVTVGSNATDGSTQSLVVTVSTRDGSAAIRTVQVADVSVDTTAPSIGSVTTVGKDRTQFNVEIKSDPNGIDKSSITAADFTVEDGEVDSIDTSTVTDGSNQTQIVGLTLTEPVKGNLETPTVTINSSSDGILDKLGNGQGNIGAGGDGSIDDTTNEETTTEGGIDTGTAPAVKLTTSDLDSSTLSAVQVTYNATGEIGSVDDLEVQLFNDSSSTTTPIATRTSLSSVEGLTSLTVPPSAVGGGTFSGRATLVDTSAGDTELASESKQIVAYNNIRTSVKTGSLDSGEITVEYDLGSLDPANATIRVSPRNIGTRFTSQSTVPDQQQGQQGTVTFNVANNVNSRFNVQTGIEDTSRNRQIQSSLGSGCVGSQKDPCSTVNESQTTVRDAITGEPVDIEVNATLDYDRSAVDWYLHPTGSPEQKDISVVSGVDATTPLQVNIGVDDFDPVFVLGTGNADGWEKVKVDKDTKQIRINVTPAEAYVEPDVENPDPSEWPLSDYTASKRYGAIVDMIAVSLEGRVNPGYRNRLDGAFIGTNAQAFSVPRSNPGGDSPGSLTITVAAPHYETDGETINDGFYNARIPKSVLAAWGIAPGEVTATYKGSSVSKSEGLTVEDKKGAIFVSMPVTYSSGTVTVSGTEDTTAPTLSNVNLDTDGSGNLVFTVDSDEQLGGTTDDLSVTVDGPQTTDVYAFDRNDFTEGGSGPFTYTLDTTQAYNNGEGTYTATVDTTKDSVGNDGSGPGLTDLHTHSTSVTTPVFVSSATATTAETASGTLIDINATDGEGGAVDSGVDYTISGGVDNSSFSIDAETGSLSFAESVDFENPVDADGDNGYAVAVTATSSTATSTQSLTVTVQNSDEAPAGTLNLTSAQPGERTVSVVGNTSAYTFNASKIVDPEGTGVSYAWTFDDGTTASSATVTRNYDTIVSSYLGETTVSPELIINDGTQQTTIDNITVTFYNDLDGDGLADDDTAQGVPTDNDDDGDGILDVNDEDPAIKEESSISGSIADADGNTITSGDVTVVRADATHKESVSIDSNGNYKLTVPAGTYRIIVENTSLPDHELEDIEVNRTTTREHDITLERLGTVTGSFTNPSGAGAANIPVHISNGDETYYTKTNSAGEYSVSVAPGSYVVAPLGNQLGNGSQEVSVTVGETTRHSAILQPQTVETSASLSIVDGPGSVTANGHEMIVIPEVTGGLLQIQIANKSDPNRDTNVVQDPSELEGFGITDETEFEITVTVSNYTPHTLFWAIRNAEFESEQNATNPKATDITIRGSPVTLATTSSQQKRVGPLVGEDPSKVSWPDGASDTADSQFNQTVFFSVYDLSTRPERLRKNLTGLIISTNAQRISLPEVSDSRLRTWIAGPSFKSASGDRYEGFYQTKIPQSQLNTWGIEAPASQLFGKYKSSDRQLTVENVDGGISVDVSNISYSASYVDVKADSDAPIPGSDPEPEPDGSDETDSDTGDSTGPSSEDDSGDSTGDDSGSSSGDDSGDSTGDDSGSSSGDDSGSDTGGDSQSSVSAGSGAIGGSVSGGGGSGSGSGGGDGTDGSDAIADVLNAITAPIKAISSLSTAGKIAVAVTTGAGAVGAAYGLGGDRVQTPINIARRRFQSWLRRRLRGLTRKQLTRTIARLRKRITWSNIRARFASLRKYFTKTYWREWAEERRELATREGLKQYLKDVYHANRKRKWRGWLRNRIRGGVTTVTGSVVGGIWAQGFLSVAGPLTSVAKLFVSEIQRWVEDIVMDKFDAVRDQYARVVIRSNAWFVTAVDRVIELITGQSSTVRFESVSNIVGDDAEAVAEAGIESVEQLAETNPAHLATALEVEEAVTIQWVEQADEAVSREHRARFRNTQPVERLTQRLSGLTAPIRVALKALFEHVSAILGLHTVSDGDSPETLDSISGIGPVYRERLEATGITSVSKLANSDPEPLSQEINLPSRVVRRWISYAEDHTRDRHVYDQVVLGNSEGSVTVLRNMEAPHQTQLDLNQNTEALDVLSSEDVHTLAEVGIDTTDQLAAIDPETLASDLSIDRAVITQWIEAAQDIENE